MIDAIYIPTLGRHNNQITFDSMTPNAQAVTTLVVQPKEKHLYPNYPIVVLPDIEIGFAALPAIFAGVLTSSRPSNCSSLMASLASFGVMIPPFTNVE